MKIIKVKDWNEIPKNFTGIVEYKCGIIEYLLNGKLHRLDGAAVVYVSGHKSYYINGKHICSSSNKGYEQIFYNSKEYKQYTMLENMKLIKNINL